MKILDFEGQSFGLKVKICENIGVLMSKFVKKLDF